MDTTKIVPNDSAVNSFINAIRSSSVDDIKKMIDMYTPELVNKLELQSRQPSIFFAAVILDEETSYEIVKLLLDAGANPFFKDQALQTVMFYVCREGKTKIFELLIDRGVSLNDVDIYGQTPIYYIARDNRMNLIEVIDKKHVKIDYNHSDKIANQTCLFYAASQGHLGMCKALIERGANVLHQDTSNKTAASYAKKMERNDVFQYLNTEILKHKALKTDQKKKSSKKLPQTKNQYKLVKSDEFGNITEMTLSDVQALLQQHPHLRSVLQNPDAIDQDEVDAFMNSEHWHKTAMKILMSCWKGKNASMFHEPVDVAGLGIYDYPEVVTKPMDFGTIKKKLTYNVYENAQKFVEDMHLVFQNCVTYNGMDNDYGKTALGLKAMFDDLVKESSLLALAR